MPTWTAPGDVTGSWIGDDAPDDAAKIQMWIEKAERQIRRRVPDIVVRIAAEAAETPSRTELMETAKDVVVAMVTRVFRNPEGARTRSDSEVTGPFTGTKTVTLGGDTPGSLDITDAELAALQGRDPSAAFTINLIPATSPLFGGS